MRILASTLLVVASLGAQTLTDLADERGIHIGTAVDPSHLAESDYAVTLAREFNQVEPENAMKFGPIHPSPAEYNFDPADAIVSFAHEHHMAVRGHTLVWYNQLPNWLRNTTATPEQLSAILQDHISTVVGRYAGIVYAWDVVNEAFNDNGSLRSFLWSDSPGIGKTGTGYIEQALRWAKAADPKALLFYNDYGAETLNSKSDSIYRMAQDFKARGVPLDGIGLQMHLTTNPGSLASMEANIKRLTDLGLQVQITELDVRLPVGSSGVASASALATEAQIYHDVVALCLKFPRCTAVQTWGFTDKYSWIPYTYQGFGAALEFDMSYQPKAAYSAMRNALQTSPPVTTAAGLVNAASYKGGPIAPGEVILLFGATFGPPALALAGPDATECAGTRLLFDGIAAPVIYAKVGQMAAVVPNVIAGSATTRVEYEYQGLRSDAMDVPVAATAPGVFTPLTSPAHPGGLLSIFITGEGGLIPSVQIGSFDCPVQKTAVVAPGVTEIDCIIDAAVPSGEQPLTVLAGGASSQEGVTVTVE